MEESEETFEKSTENADLPRTPIKNRPRQGFQETRSRFLDPGPGGGTDRTQMSKSGVPKV